MESNLVRFSSLKEGEPFKNPKTRSEYVKQHDSVYNAKSKSGVGVRFKDSDQVQRIEK